MSAKTMKDNIFSTYLSSLCVFNIITLVWCVPRFIIEAYFGWEIYFKSPNFCLIYKVLVFSLSSIVNWHLVAITAARLFFLMDKKKRYVNLYGTPRIIIIGIVVLVCAVEVPTNLLWVRYIDEFGLRVECYTPNRSIFVHFQLGFQMLFPVVMLTFLNMSLLYLLRRSTSGMVESTTTTRIRMQLVLLVFLSSMQYLITLSPMVLFFPLAKYIIDVDTVVGQAKARLGFGMCLLMYTNNGTNFLVYCFFGRKFRFTLLKLLSTHCLVCPKILQTGFNLATGFSTSDFDPGSKSKGESSPTQVTSDTTRNQDIKKTSQNIIVLYPLEGYSNFENFSDFSYHWMRQTYSDDVDGKDMILTRLSSLTNSTLWT